MYLFIDPVTFFIHIVIYLNVPAYKDFVDDALAFDNFLCWKKDFLSTESVYLSLGGMFLITDRLV